MSGRRFEWSNSPHASFDAWELLDALDVDEMDEAPGWFMNNFSIWPKEEERELSCSFEEWCEEPDDVAVYLAEAYDEAFGDYPVGLVYAREVPGYLLFGCALAIDHEKQSFEATFAALSGREVLRVSKDLPEILRIGDLVRMVTGAAISQRLLKSQNQEVRVLLVGHADQLGVQTVLWNKRRPSGLLQRR